MNGREIHFNTTAIYSFFKQHFKEFYKLNPISQREFMKILDDCNNAIFDLIIYEAFELKMPCLGTLRVKMRKKKVFKDNGELNYKVLKVNWKETSKLWSEDKEAKRNKKIIFYLNENGYRFLWNKAWVKNTKNKEAYALEVARVQKQKLVAALTNPEKEYIYYS